MFVLCFTSTSQSDTQNTTSNTELSTVEPSLDTISGNLTICPDVCSCYRYNLDEGTSSASSSFDLTNCTKRGLVEIPANIDPSTNYLYLVSNQITTLENGGLSHLNLLLELDLRYNRLVWIAPKSFIGLQSLRWLLLDDAIQPGTYLDTHLLNPLVSLNLISIRRCNLKKIPPEFFALNKDLYCIYLSDNKLSIFPERSFQDLTELTEIYLDNNRIEFLPNDIFKGDYQLREIGLQNNSIEIVSQDAGLQYLALQVLNISNNSFSCTCQLAWFAKWLNESFMSADVIGSAIESVSSGAELGSHSFAAQLQCHSPKHLRGVKLLDLSSHVNCNHEGTRIGMRIGISTGVIIGISTGVIAILGVVLVLIIYFYRWHCR